MKRLKHISLFVFLFSFFISGNSQVIENLDFVQEGKNIQITYDLVVADENQQLDVEVFFSIDGGLTWEGPLNEVTGNVGPDQTAGRNLSIIWNVLAEKKSLVGEIQFKVEAVINEVVEPVRKFHNTPHRKGFIGLTIGLTIPLGWAEAISSGVYKDTRVNPYVQFNVIDFGYLFWKNIGFTSQLNYGVQTTDYYDGASFQYYSILGGLLISFHSKKVDYDIRLMLGPIRAIFVGPHINKETSDIDYNGKLGFGIRWHVKDRLSILINVEADHSSLHFNEWNHYLTSFNLNGGIAYRFK